MADEKRFSKRAQKVLALANQESKNLRCGHVASEHLLLGALRSRSKTVSAVLVKAGLSLTSLRANVARVGSLPEEAPHGYGPSMHGALRRAYRHSEAFSHAKIEPEHLLLGVVDEAHGGAARALRHFRVDAAAVKRCITRWVKK